VDRADHAVAVHQQLTPVRGGEPGELVARRHLPCAIDGCCDTRAAPPNPQISPRLVPLHIIAVNEKHLIRSAHSCNKRRRHNDRVAQTMTVVVPVAVHRVVDAWRSEGSQPQAGIPWPRRRWRNQFPHHSATLAALPDALSRGTVRRASRDALESPAAAERAFLVAMVWGYGEVGYGPFRVERILSSTTDATARLCAAARVVARDGMMGGYGHLASAAGRLRYLGPAFGTKFLFFCSPSSQRPALILDRLVATWLAENAGMSLDHVSWSPPTYKRYIETIYAWAHAEDMQPADLEECIFTAQARRAGSQWATST
jgi:hypothetical protein